MTMKEKEIDFKMYDRVRLKKTGEIGFIVWYADDYPAYDSFLIEIAGKNEMPKFYERDDFEVLGE
jgi:hypothetical protein